MVNNFFGPVRENLTPLMDGSECTSTMNRHFKKMKKALTQIGKTCF